MSLILTKEETKIILQHRLEIKQAKERALRQKTCKHEFYYSGHGHNDDCYTCKKCGVDEWR